MSGMGFGLGTEDRGDPGRRRTSAVAIGVAVVVVLVLLISIAVVGGRRLVDFFGAAPDYSGQGEGSTTVVVHPGDSAAAIGRTLADAHVVKSAEAFTDAAASNDKARSIQPGTYRLREHMKAVYALDLLLDPTSKVVARVLIPEGTRLTRIIEILHDSAGIATKALNDLVAHPGPLHLPSYAHGSVEGFLFPATYDFPPGTSATGALRAMVNRFKAEAKAVNLVDGARALGYTPYDVVTIASLVEKEARLEQDFAKVARVAYNRLSPAWGSKPFGFDSTLNYAFPEAQGHLTYAELHSDSPYNSRVHSGLPPTPIDSPGHASLEAALHPTPGDWLYFVTIDQAGHTAFSTTYAQFQHDKETSRANGVH